MLSAICDPRVFQFTGLSNYMRYLLCLCINRDLEIVA